MSFRSAILAACTVLLSSSLSARSVCAQVDLPGDPDTSGAALAVMPLELEGVDVNEHLNKPLPLDATFRDHTGKVVTLGQYFDGKRPVALTLAYHSCKVVCSMVLGAEAESLKNQPWTLGHEFRAVTISIDPRDTPKIAAKKRQQMLALAGQKDGWDFLVGDQANIDKVAKAVGFSYRYDPRHDQYAHPAVLMLATPQAKMARYLYGLEFAPNDVRLGLLEASQGRSISTVEKAILYCYMYDPIGAKYVVVAKNVMKLGGVVTMFALGIYLALLWRRESRSRRRSREAKASSLDPQSRANGPGAVRA